jgi:hypothetical protein
VPSASVRSTCGMRLTEPRTADAGGSPAMTTRASRRSWTAKSHAAGVRARKVISAEELSRRGVASGAAPAGFSATETAGEPSVWT